jgi:hypothetical protein
LGTRDWTDEIITAIVPRDEYWKVCGKRGIYWVQKDPDRRRVWVFVEYDA